MANRYELVEERGEFRGREVPDRPMIVRLYPNTREQIGACDSGGIAATSVLHAGEQLYQYGSVDYYAVYRYRTEHSNLEAPDEHVDWRDISPSFKEFLRSENGSEENLYRYRGVHQLIHGKPTACDEDAGGYAPTGAGAEYTDASAFAEAVVAWSPRCPDVGLTRNATIQEAVHCFMFSDIYSDDLTGSEDDEHSLGRVEDWQTTPMLTYHWDDDAIDEFGGECPSTNDVARDHTQLLTDCAKEAVDQTAAAKAYGVLG